MNHKEKVSRILMIVGFNIKRIRTEKKMTQLELAYLCEMERKTISSIETFKLSGLNISTIIKISEVLEVEIGELFKK